jgi:hypothetical protein
MSEESCMGRPRIYKTPEEAHIALRKCQRAFYHKNREAIRLYQFKRRFLVKKGREPDEEEVRKFQAKRSKTAAQ